MHHWHVPADRAREFKVQLEALGLKPKLKSLGAEVHVAAETAPAAGTEGWPPGASSDPSCTLCLKSAPLKRLRYAVYPPMVLFGASVSIEDAQRVLDLEKCTHAAINRPIPVADIVRRPQITPLIGDFGEYDPDGDFERAFWCTCKQNGIHQTWAPLYTMFSRGNVTEKKRVLGLDNVAGQVVADLYCGIGYFTFSYTKAGAKRVYGWELNRWSVEGLRRAALVNKWNVRVIERGQEYTADPSDRIVVFNESNVHALERLTAVPELPALAHINMGLLPDCRLAWDLAKRMASTGTAFHIHENVHEREMDQWTAKIGRVFGPVSHVERIKQFSPGVWHVCADAHRRTVV